MTIEDIVNQVLTEIGYGKRIGDLYEGSEAAKAALEIWGQTRDELLDDGEWPLARRPNIPLALLKGPPPPGGYNPDQPWSAQYPPPGWLYEYAYPADMITLLTVVAPPGMMPDLNPQPGRWRVDNDNSLVDNTGAVTVQKKVIVTNIKNALAVYIGQVIDPNLWEPGFIRVLTKRLAPKLARRLRISEDIVRDEAATGTAIAGAAESARG